MLYIQAKVVLLCERCAERAGCIKLRRQIIRSQVLSWVLVLVVGALVYASIQHNAAITDQRRQAQAELLQIETVRTDVLDLETGLRGFFVTGINQYLEPFNRARANVNQDIQSAYALIGNTPEDAAANYLTAFGHPVTKAYGGAHGIALAECEHPDLIILDLMMPEVNGFMVVDRLRSIPRTAGIPIIILTAKIVSAEERKRLNGHIVAVAEKSGINRVRFLNEVSRAVGQRDLARQS
jgi:CheY-like chemotaxis protein